MPGSDSVGRQPCKTSGGFGVWLGQSEALERGLAVLLVSCLVLMASLSLPCWLCSWTGPLEVVSRIHRLDLMSAVTDLGSRLSWTHLAWTQWPVCLSLPAPHFFTLVPMA